MNPRIVGILLPSAAVCGAPQGMAQTKTSNVEVDFARAGSTIRALNGVNGGPLCERGWVDLSVWRSG
jgi:hypothetical protein